jgi:AcrR family transcriptional regulator
MSETGADKRRRLTQAAVEMAYRQGFRKTTIADIAEEAQVPAGNVYYYYKTKDEIGEAILEHRRSEFAVLRERLEQLASPRARLAGFVHMTVDNREWVAARGCPMGSLSAELLKDGGELAVKSNVLFSEPMAWMERQFRAMGKGEESAAMTLHLQSALQGVSLLAQSFGDPHLIEIEAQHLLAWLDGL